MRGKQWMILLVCAACCGSVPTYAAEVSAAQTQNEVRLPAQSADAVDLARAERYYQLGMSLLEQKETRRANDAFCEAIRANRFDARSYLEHGKIMQGVGNGLKEHYASMFQAISFASMYDIAAEEYYAHTPELERGKEERREENFKMIENVPLNLKECCDAALRAYGQALALGVNDAQAAEVVRLRGGVHRIRAEFDATLLRMEREDGDMFRLLDLLKPEGHEARSRWRRQDQALLRSAEAEIDGDFAKALRDYGEALRLNPADAEAYAGRAEAYYQRGRYRLAMVGAPGGFWAERTVRRAKPEGAEQFDLSDYRSAIADYERALALMPERAEFLLKLGEISKSAYDDAQAFAYYSRAAENPQARVDALYERAKLHVSLKQRAEAQKDMSAYLKVHKDMSYAVSMYNAVDDFKNKVEGILESTDKINAQPNDGALYKERAAQWFACRKFSQAMDDYARATERGVRTAELYWMRGECCRNLALWKQALADYERAEANGYLSSITEESAKKFYRSRAMARVSLKQYPAAASDYTRALQHGAGDVALYFERSKCYKEAGFYHMAAADLLQALLDNADTNSAIHAYWELSQLYEGDLHDEDQLLTCYNEILRLLPENHSIRIDFAVIKRDDVRMKRALLLDRRGEEEKAAAEFRLIQEKEFYDANLRAMIPEKYRLSQKAAQ